MKRIKYYALSAVLLLCGTGLTTSCSVDDNPVAPSPEEQEAIDNRNELVRHIDSDAKTMADMFDVESLNVAAQAYEQLSAMMEGSKDFMTNMKSLLSIGSMRKAVAGISPVTSGSELAKMGYLMYISVDNSGYGIQVVFDGKGNCRLSTAKNLEFVFPADIKGIGYTLFKVIIKDGGEYYQSVSAANIPNVKGVACVNRFPRSLTMTLTGFIDNKEQTLSETVIGLELPMNENSKFVSLDAKSFNITGQQHSYSASGKESTLDFSLNNNNGNMALSYGYACDGTSIVDCVALMRIKQQSGFIGQMSGDALNVADINSVAIRILNDLTLSGTISGGDTFSQNFASAIKNRQQVSSQDALAGIVESLNQSTDLQLSCMQITKAEVMKFCVTEKDKHYIIEPALKDLNSDKFIPISDIVDAQTMENFNKPFSMSFTPGGNAAGSALNVYSALIQMMPLND